MWGKKVSKLFNTAVFKMRDLGDREMAQQLRAFAALAGDQNSQDSHQAVGKDLYLQLRKIQCPLLAFLGTCAHVYASSHPTHINRNIFAFTNEWPKCTQAFKTSLELARIKIITNKNSIMSYFYGFDSVKS